MINHHQGISPVDEGTAGVADLPSRVLVALDHVQPEEREGVRAVVTAFARGQVTGRRVASEDPVVRLQATPDLLVFERREPGGPVQVLDIVRPATLRMFADAARTG